MCRDGFAVDRLLSPVISKCRVLLTRNLEILTIDSSVVVDLLKTLETCVRDGAWGYRLNTTL